MAKTNHIGTAFEMLKTIAENLGWNYSHGTNTEFALKKYVSYPLLHAVVESVSQGEKTARVTFRIVLADQMNRILTENSGKTGSQTADDVGYTENENYVHILQELYHRFAVQVDKVQDDNYGEVMFEYPISYSPFIEDDGDVLAGHLITITIQVLSPNVTDGVC